MTSEQVRAEVAGGGFFAVGTRCLKGVAKASSFLWEVPGAVHTSALLCPPYTPWALLLGVVVQAFHSSTLEADTETDGSVSLIYIGVTASQGYTARPCPEITTTSQPKTKINFPMVGLETLVK